MLQHLLGRTNTCVPLLGGAIKLNHIHVEAEALVIISLARATVDAVYDVRFWLWFSVSLAVCVPAIAQSGLVSRKTAKQTIPPVSNWVLFCDFCLPKNCPKHASTKHGTTAQKAFLPTWAVLAIINRTKSWTVSGAATVLLPQARTCFIYLPILWMRFHLAEH